MLWRAEKRDGGSRNGAGEEDCPQMPRGRERRRSTRGASSALSIKAIDLFCGAGGLTRGLEAAGIEVVMGVDVDPACEYPFTANNRATFLLKSVEAITGSDFTDTFMGASF